MRLRISLFFILLLNVWYVNATEIFTPPVRYNTFKAGELLTYQIRYGFIIGGITNVSITEANYDKKSVIHAVGIGQTSGMADKIYGVTDIYESWFDKGTNLPYKQIRNIKEGSYKWYNEVTYNRKNNTVNSKRSGIHNVPEKILDLVSTFYYIRRIDFTKVKEGDIIFVNMYFGDEIFPFRLRFRGKETIKTDFGKISCYKICPIVEVGRMFKSPDDLTIWFSDDGNCVPISIRMNIRIVGSVYLELIKYQNTMSPLIFRK